MSHLSRSFLESVELLALKRGSIHHGELYDALRAGTEVEDDEETYAASIKSESELVADSIFSALESRQRIVGNRYPLTINATTIEAKADWEIRSSLPFLSLLRKSAPASLLNEQRKDFEMVAGSAVARFFRAERVDLGAPRRAPVPGGLKSAVEYTTNLIGDGNGVNPHAAITDSGDKSMDSVVYKIFRDTDSGVLDQGNAQRMLISVACATGIDWEKDNKPFEPAASNLRVYTQHLISPVWQVFCVPDFEIKQSPLEQAGGVGILVFSGFRIARYANEVPPTARVWVREQIDDMPDDFPDLPI